MARRLVMSRHGAARAWQRVGFVPALQHAVRAPKSGARRLGWDTPRSGRIWVTSAAVMVVARGVVVTCGC